MLGFAMGNGLTGFGAGVDSAAAAVTVSGSNTVSSTSDLTTYTFSSVSGLGAHTHLLLTVTLAGGSGTINSVTVAGSAATAIATINNGAQRSAIYAIAESITSPTIVVEVTAAPRSCVVGIVACNGIQSLTPVATATSTSNTPSLNANTSAGGVAIAVAMVVNGGSMTWTGVTEQYDTALESTDVHSWGYSLTASGETPRSISVTYTVPYFPTALSATFR